MWMHRGKIDVRSWRMHALIVAVFVLIAASSAFSFASSRHLGDTVAEPSMYVSILSPIDRTLPGRERYKRYTVDVNAGDVWTFQVHSPHFSPYIMVRHGRGQQDAGGLMGQKKAQLRYEARRTERIDVWVSTSARAEMGLYALQTTKTRDERLVERPSTSIRSELVANSRVEGHIDATTDRTSTGIGVHRYEYFGEAGERIVLRATSPRFVPLLMLHGLGVALHSGDPVGRERAAMLEAELPESGRYVVRVLSGPGVEDAPYTLRVRRAYATESTSTPRLVVGAHMEGTFDNTTTVLSKGHPAVRYQLRLEKGQRVRLHLQTSAFEGTVRVQELVPAALDDESEGTEASNRAPVVAEAASGKTLTFQARSTGDYEVVVSASKPRARGEYVLSVLRDQEGTPDTSKDAQDLDGVRTPLRADRVTRGQLKVGAPQMQDLSYYHAYRLPVNAGERWTLEMSSLSFDTHLELRGPRGFSLANDDRDIRDTDSLITFDAPFDGDLTIYATSHLPRAVGPFSLHAYRGDPAPRTDEAREGRLVALLVGITEYDALQWERLPYCASDAVRVGEALESTGMLAPESVILVDGGATRDALVRAFERAAEVVGPNDVFFFFFSGHGGQLPSDDPMERDGLDETLVMHDGQIRDDEFGDLLLNVDSRLSIVVLDACYSGGFRDTLRRRKNQVGIFSSEEDVSSLVAEQFEAGGYLSNILLYGLAGSADQSPVDGAVTVDELLQYLRTSWTEFGQVLAWDSNDRFAHQELVIERGYTPPQEVIFSRPPTQK